MSKSLAHSRKSLSRSRTTNELRLFKPIRKVWIHDKAFAASRLSMMRIMAMRMKAMTVVA